MESRIAGRMITKDKITGKSISCLLFGYGILLFLIVGDEVFDFPHTVFGFQATPSNWAETLIEGVYIVSLCTFSVVLSLRLLKKMRFLEGILSICMNCKKVRDGDEWVSIDTYISEHSEALFSHGLCPECAERYRAQILESAHPQPQKLSL